MPTPAWKIIPSAEVHAVWLCPRCGASEVVDPGFYQESGTPLCTADDCNDGDGVDMEYSHTEVLSRA